MAFVAVALLGATPASAWWADGGSYRSGSYGAVEVTAEPGEQNDLTATQRAGVGVGNSNYVILHDDSAPVTPPPAGDGDGCSELDSHTLRCTGLDMWGAPMGIDYLWTDLGDGDDRLRIPATSLPMFLWASTGSGNDAVGVYDVKGASLDLGEGNDRIVLRGSQGAGVVPNDQIAGSLGDDVLDVRNGSDDNPTCGDGNDILYADPVESNADCEEQHSLLP